MHNKKLFLPIVVAILIMPGVIAFAQAHVAENQKTYIYVDGNYGSDANGGMQADNPLQTIQAAVEKARVNNTNSIGTKVLINAGIYREFVNIQSTKKQTDAPMTFEAVYPGSVTISGSDVLTHGIPDPGNPAVYEYAWNHDFGGCRVPQGWPTTFAPVVLQTEMVFVNHIPLTQVMSFDQMRKGTFYVNEKENHIHIWPGPYARDMSKALVEAAVRPQTLALAGRKNVVLRGLVFQHAANCINTSGATVSSSTNVLIDQVQAMWNNWGGLAISYSTGITLQNSVASHNGGVGFAGMADRDVLLDFNESDYNNWRGAMGALYDWGMGGTKFMWTHNATIKNQYSYRNQAQGLWFDTDNKNIVIDNATLSENVLSSLQLEANEGPISLSHSKLCSSGSGATVINTEKLTMTSNTFYNNSGTNKWQGQVFLAGKPGGRHIEDWETGEPYFLFTSATKISSNSFQNAQPGQFVFATFLSGKDWSQFADSLASGHNHWYDSTTAKVFKIPKGKLVDLHGWQLETRADLTSNWISSASVAASCEVPPPSFTDFSVNADNNAYQMKAGSTAITLRVNSFKYGQVTLAASGVPQGVTASFSPRNLLNGVTVLTLAASKNAKHQTVPITIFANSGSRVHSVTVSVEVNK